MDKYSWILVVLTIAAVLVCLLLREPTQTEIETPLTGTKQINASQNCLQSHEDAFPMLDTDDPSSSRFLRKSFYNNLEGMNIEESASILSYKGKEAQLIVPQFPDFPDVWLLSPTSKGKHSSLGERYCIEFLELLFPGHNFKKMRPKWLRNPKTNRPLELDGYCEELMIAVEYNGIQHYEWPNFTRCSQNDFFRQRERDQIKEETCINRNICLIRIPYTVKLARIPLAIYSRLLDAVPELNI